MRRLASMMCIALILVPLAAFAAPSEKEAPMLRDLVSAGELPPLEERLPEEPLTVQGEGIEIGQYGGTLQAGAFGPKSGGLDSEAARLQNLFQIEPDLRTISPNIAKSWDLSDDFKTLTISLRKGMKWSDGTPFTADDFLFWYEDIALNEELTPTKLTVWQPGGEMLKMVKVDDYTVRMEFAAPYPAIDVALGKSYWNGRFFHPKHYLQKWHITYNPDADKLAKEEGYDSWWQCFQYHMAFQQDQQDVNLPGIAPWILEEVDVSGNKYFTRNPYYWKVDTEGNQLPYIDKQVRIIVKNAEVRVLKLIAGELHNAGENPLPVKDYTLYKENEAKGNYTVSLFQNTRGSDSVFGFNLTHKDPVLKEVFNNFKFREAMSLAINRQEVNDVLYFGKATIRQATVPPITSFYEDWMGQQYIEFDPDQANALLDEIGLKWDANKETRLRPDGKPFQIVLECTEEFAPMSEIVAEHWTKVGIKTSIKQEERMFFLERGPANERDASAWTYDGVSEFMMRTSDDTRIRPPWGTYLETAPLWKAWFDSQGASGEEPPEIVQKSYNLCNEFKLSVPGTEKYMALGKEILTIHAENLWVIGTTVAPRVIMISNTLANTPKQGTFAWDFGFWVPYSADKWYFK